MGSLARMNQCKRFIEEFNSTAIEQYGLSIPGIVISQSLGFSADDEMVRFYISLNHNGKSVEVMIADTVFFDPEEDNKATIDRLSILFQLPATTVEERLKKAKLL